MVSPIYDNSVQDCKEVALIGSEYVCLDSGEVLGYLPVVLPVSERNAGFRYSVLSSKSVFFRAGDLLDARFRRFLSLLAEAGLPANRVHEFRGVLVRYLKAGNSSFGVRVRHTNEFVILFHYLAWLGWRYSDINDLARNRFGRRYDRRSFKTFIAWLKSGETDPSVWR